jgi:hypothetical protein
MNGPGIEVHHLTETAETMRSCGYFVDALAKLVASVGEEDPLLAERVLDGYVLGGLVAGLRLAGAEMMGQGEHLETLIAQAKVDCQGGAA